MTLSRPSLLLKLCLRVTKPWSVFVKLPAVSVSTTETIFSWGIRLYSDDHRSVVARARLRLPNRFIPTRVCWSPSVAILDPPSFIRPQDFFFPVDVKPNIALISRSHLATAALEDNIFVSSNNMWPLCPEYFQLRLNFSDWSSWQQRDTLRLDMVPSARARSTINYTRNQWVCCMFCILQMLLIFLQHVENSLNVVPTRQTSNYVCHILNKQLESSTIICLFGRHWLLISIWSSIAPYLIWYYTVRSKNYIHMFQVFFEKLPLTYQ